MVLNLIAAVGKRGQLGLNNKLPWKDSEDLLWFKKLTMGGIVIMGAKTASNLPGSLPGRELIVPTRYETPEQIIDKLKHDYRNVWVAGGAKTYQAWMPFIQRFYISRVDYDGPADVWMPNLTWDK